MSDELQALMDLAIRMGFTEAEAEDMLVVDLIALIEVDREVSGRQWRT